MCKKEIKRKSRPANRKLVYRLRGRKFFLTYNPCPLELSSVLEQLKRRMFNVGKGNYLDQYLIVRESVNGARHVHVYIELNKTYDSKNPHCFDLVGEDNAGIHGNYQKSKNSDTSIEYMLKDINDKHDSSSILYSKGLDPLITRTGCFLTLDESLIALAKEGRIKEAMDLLERKNPARYLRSHVKVERSLRDIRMRALGFETKCKL